jgi:hypothetical protein
MVSTFCVKPDAGVALYNNNNDLIYVPRYSAYFTDSNEDGEFGYEGDESISDIGCYDPSRDGAMVSEYFVHGTVIGLCIMDDGTLVAGISGYNLYNDPTISTVAENPIEISIPDVYLQSIDKAPNSNIVYGAAWDYYSGKQALNGYILSWNYNTGEYQILNSGIPVLVSVTYHNNILYGTTGEDNIMYVIPLD